MGWVKRKSRALVNAALTVMMAALYVTISTPQAKAAISELYNSPIYRGHKESVIALECAVSWNAEALATMLDILEDNDVSITFFVSGDWAEKNLEMMERMVREGHEIGTMGMTPGEDGDGDTVTRDVECSILSIKKACGVEPTLYYSGTRKEKPSSHAAAKLGLTHVLCTVDLLSGRGSSEDILVRALDKPFKGSIILIQPTHEAVRALPACLDGLRQQGLRVCTVSEALA